MKRYSDITKKDEQSIYKEFTDRMKEQVEYKTNMFTVKYITDSFINQLRNPPAEIVVSDQIELGTVHIMTDSKAIREYELKNVVIDVPAGCKIEFIPLQEAWSEKEIKIPVNMREAGSEIKNNTDIDLGNGAVCVKCNKHNEYAEGSSEFVCWGCRNGY